MTITINHIIGDATQPIGECQKIVLAAAWLVARGTKSIH